jgi:putative FmdB family regulatory protein
MPIYGYRCDECGHELEVFQSMSDAPLKTCPVCGGSLRKMLYPVGVQFKGSGFYTTDYRDGGLRSGSKGSDGPSGSEGKSESKSESKPESKSDSKSGDAGAKSSDQSASKKSDTPAAKGGD